ncbi:MAG: Ribosome-recycling factor [SAR116 cluster bacterium]|nr:ribosome recycling factor [Pseudomonadota bacterium]CAI8243371.1 MAG: Ribosome-recycling factor [SAR116 cluster bacterium]|tara:strand:- start:109 stop:666 length:558 start_codon:yes stop_codon:yes gene_type:complete
MSALDLDDIKRRMEGSLNSLKTEFMGLRAGRASTAMLEPIMVEAYGSKMPMNQVGNISVPEPRLLTVTVWDAGLTSSVEKAIRESDLGLNPMAEGTLIRVPIPDLSEERRKDMVKVAGRYAEAARVAVRNVRRDGIEAARKLEKDSEISEDERHDLETDIQKLTDDHVKQIDDALSNKETEITQV